MCEVWTGNLFLQEIKGQTQVINKKCTINDDQMGTTNNGHSIKAQSYDFLSSPEKT